MGIVTDYNKMSVNELLKLRSAMFVNYVIENGKITGIESDKEKSERKGE